MYPPAKRGRRGNIFGSIIDEIQIRPGQAAIGLHHFIYARVGLGYAHAAGNIAPVECGKLRIGAGFGQCGGVITDIAERKNRRAAGAKYSNCLQSAALQARPNHHATA